MAKGEFIHEGRTFTFREILKPVTVHYTTYKYSLEIDGEDKSYIKKNKSKLKAIVELYYLHGKN